MIDKNSKILVVGDHDHIEQGVYRYLTANKFTNVFSSSLIGLDPSIQPSVYAFFQKERPDYVVLSSTRCGGIGANQAMPADFIYHNSESQNNIVYSSWKWPVKKLIYVAASCVYPKEAAQPIKEEDLLTGPLEPTSEPYSVAKIAGIRLCDAFRKQYGLNAVSIVPATPYGPVTEIDAAKSHVTGAFLKNFHDAAVANQPEVKIWGTGEARREFLYIDDLVEAIMLLLEKDVKHNLLNIGIGNDVSIRELAEIVAETVGFKGKISCDTTKPDGAKQKMLNSSRIRDLGWRPKVSLRDGIERCYELLNK